MKIKRFFANDIRNAIRQVREELGPDAVILSNRNAEGGVEIVAAVDYDERLLNPPEETPSAGGAVSLKAREPATYEKPRTGSAPAAGGAMSDPAVGRRSTTDGPRRAMKIEWSQDPVLVDMRKELRQVRSLLENQLSGLAWSDLMRRYPMYAELLQKLMKLGLNTEICRQVADAQDPHEDLQELWQHALACLEKQIPIASDDLIENGGVAALVGPTGVGKTTTVAKIAARYALRHGARHVALVTTDNYRIGAYEQLRAYGRILDIPVRMATNRDELREIMGDLYDRRLILIDTAGMSQRDDRIPEQLAFLSQQDDPIKVYMVLSTTTRLSALEEIVRVYSSIDIAACILTKVDETTSLGSAVSTVIAHNLPVAYVSNGQRVPEDIHPARARSLVDQCVRIMSDNEIYLEHEALAANMGKVIANAQI